MIPGYTNQTSNRLGNVHYPRALHHDRCAVTGDRTRDARYKNPDAYTTRPRRIPYEGDE